jgi:hypothetical protein
MKDVQLGQAAVIDLRAKANLVGIVSRIHPGATEGVVTVDVHIPGKLPPQATAGVPVDGIITIGRMTNVVYVGRPVWGRADSEGSLLRLEPDGKQAVRVKVRFGRSAVNLIEVRTGLQPGDKVILNDMEKYQDADRVNLK